MTRGWKPNFGLALISAIAMLSGCAVGPDYKRPEASIPANYRGVVEAPGTNSLADLAWWDLYKDSALASYIRTALTNNYNARLAVTRVEQARQFANQAKSRFLPSAGYQAGVGYGKNEFVGSASPDGQKNDSALVLANAVWEVDLWGSIRRMNESARAQFLAAREAQEGVQISLIAAVAQAYFELLALDLQLEIAQRTTNSFGETLQIFNLRFGRGMVSKLEVARAEAALASAAATLPDLERQIALKENELSVLLGRPPGPIERKAKLLDQNLPIEIPAGLPSSLLERRPDVREAEQLVRSANAQVGVAMAEFFPKIGLTAFAGKVSPELSAFTAGSANAWSLAANATGPIFQGGALQAQYRQARAFWEETSLQYEQTALIALREVADALVTHEKLGMVRKQQAVAVAAYTDAVKLSTQRYVAGTAEYFEVLDAQLQLFPAENTLAQVDLSRRLAIVQLYRALGGGWQPVAAKQ